MANGVKLETAYIELQLDDSNLEGQLKDSLDKAGKPARESGRKIGKEVSGGFKESIRGMEDHLKDSWNRTLPKAKDAGKKIGKEISGAVKDGLQDPTIRKTIDDLAQGAAAGIGQKIGEAIGGTQVGKAINDIADKAGENIAKALKGITDHDAGGAISGLAGALRDLGQTGAADTLGTIGTKAGELQSKTGELKSNIEGTSTSLMTLTNNSGRIAGGLGAINSAAGPLAATFGILTTLMPGFNDALNRIQAGQGSLKDFFNVLTPGTNLIDQAIKDSGAGGHGIRSPLPRGPVGNNPPIVSAGPLVPLGMQGAPGSLDPFSALDPSRVLNTPPAGSKAGPQLANVPWGPNALATPSAYSMPLGPGKAPESGLQTRTIGASRAISAAFPEIQEIGGYRQDSKPWHPSGRAIDVMIPGGSTRGGANPQGKALGDRIYAYVMANKDKLGVDYVLWQTDEGGDHYNHLHVNTIGGGYPQGGEQYQLPSFDTGGPVPEDMAAYLHGGEHVLNPEQVKALGGPEGVQAFLDGQGDAPDQGPGLNRTEGFMPAAAAGNAGGVAGTSSLAGLFNLGNQAVSGLIDTGASAAQMAISAAATAGSFGAGGQAAGPAAGMGIQLLATEGKRLSSYGFQVASIIGDAAIEQLFPFGAPRWLGYDYTSFLPDLNISQIGTTTAEKAVQQAMGQQGAQPGDAAPGTTGSPFAPLGPMTADQSPGGPVNPMTLPGAQPPGAPVPKFGPTPSAPPAAVPNTGPGGGGAPPAPVPAAPGGGGTPPPLQLPTSVVPPSVGSRQQPDVLTPTSLGGLLGASVFDDGGVWPSDTLGMNTSGRDELVLSGHHLDQLQARKPQRSSGGDTYNIYGDSPDEIARKIDSKKRLAMMRYSGRS